MEIALHEHSASEKALDGPKEGKGGKIQTAGWPPSPPHAPDVADLARASAFQNAHRLMVAASNEARTRKERSGNWAVDPSAPLLIASGGPIIDMVPNCLFSSCCLNDFLLSDRRIF